MMAALGRSAIVGPVSWAAVLPGLPGAQVPKRAGVCPVDPRNGGPPLGSRQLRPAADGIREQRWPATLRSARQLSLVAGERGSPYGYRHALD